MEKRRSKKRRQRQTSRPASVGLILENIKFSMKALFKRRSRPSLESIDEKPATPGSDGSPA